MTRKQLFQERMLNRLQKYIEAGYKFEINSTSNPKNKGWINTNKVDRETNRNRLGLLNFRVRKSPKSRWIYIGKFSS